MTNATKTLAIVFAGTLVLAFAATWGGGSTSSAAFQSQLLAVDTAQVQAVRIERPGAPTVRLERSDGQWSVVPADTSATYPASVPTVRQTLETLSSLEVSTVATRQSEKHPRYGVDTTGTTVSMLGGGGETLGQLIVGRTQIQRPPSSGQSQNPMQRMRRRRGTPITYVRSPDQPDVYSVERSLGSVVNRSVEDWRDKNIWTVDQSQVQRVDFSYPADSSFTMQRVVQRDTTAGAAASSGTWLSEGDTLATSETSSMLRRLSSPDADGFAEGTSPDALGDPLYTVQIQLADGSSRALHFHSSDSGENYLVTADGYPYVARVQAGRWDRLVLQGRSALLQTE